MTINLARDDRPVVLLDLDNCIADDSWRIPHIDWAKEDPTERYRAYHRLSAYDLPETAWLLDLLATWPDGMRVFVLTGRPEETRRLTEGWLKRHLPFAIEEVMMRKGDDCRGSVELKVGYVRDLIVAKEFEVRDVAFATDDRLEILAALKEEFDFSTIHHQIHDVCAYTNPAYRLLPSRPPPSVLSVPELLRAAAGTYEERNKVYGDNYKHFGETMRGLFPEGLWVEAEDDWARLGLYVLLIAKMSRYAASFTKGGHLDSAHDAIVYSAMLEELTGGAS